MVFLIVRAPAGEERFHETSGNKVYYREGATEIDAKKIAADLEKAGVFVKNGRYNVMLQKAADGLVLLLPLKSEYVGTKEGDALARQLEGELEVNEYYQNKLRVVVTDTNFNAAGHGGTPNKSLQ
jgi:hypothetical protein